MAVDNLTGLRVMVTNWSPKPAEEVRSLPAPLRRRSGRIRSTFRKRVAVPSPLRVRVSPSPLELNSHKEAQKTQSRSKTHVRSNQPQRPPSVAPVVLFLVVLCLFVAIDFVLVTSPNWYGSRSLTCRVRYPVRVRLSPSPPICGKGPAGRGAGPENQ